MKNHNQFTNRICPAHAKTSLGTLFDEISGLEDIHNNLDDIIWAASFDPYHCLYLNKSAEKIFGYTVREILDDGAIFTECIHPADRETFYESVNTAFRLGKSTCEFRVRHRDGSVKIIKVQAIRYDAANGGAPVLAGIATDITKETLTTEALITTRQKLRAIIDNTTDLIWSIDMEMCIVEANRAYRSFVSERFRIEEVTGRNMFEMLPPGDIITWEGYVCHALKGNVHTVMHEWEEGGERRYSKVNFNPIRDNNGEITGVSCFESDVTEQCRQMREIERKNSVMAEVAYLQSHQVRGPIASIIGLAQLFNMHNISDPVNGEVLQGLVEAAAKLDTIIGEIDTATKGLRAEAGK